METRIAGSIRICAVETSLAEAGIEKDMLSIYFHLTKLVEAAHLIDVRETTHIGGRLKNRAKVT